jgi:hypothetical protein
MVDYESKQVALWGVGLAGLLAITGIGLTLAGERQQVLAGLGLVVVALLIANFAVLKVRVTSSEVRWAFGIGWLARRIPLEEIRDVEVKRSAWYWGWGIRWTPRGWLWRSSGLDAVWLGLASGKQAGVGSHRPAELARAIRERTTPA